ncbi:MAG: glycosyltransferase family 2 protein [Bryobacterales bacterium]|nr:glycosyltransferase family 2 protein [Bryobacterales bacterium]
MATSTYSAGRTPDRTAVKEPLVVSVVLNSNRCPDTLQCLESLSASSYRTQRAIVLDNASTDGSVERIRARFPAVEIIELTENRGYAGNNNVGIAAALARGADWIFVLNEDVVFDQDCLERLVEIGESDPTIGVLGPMVYHHDEPGVIQSAGGALGPHWESVHLGVNETDTGQFRDPHPVRWISGCGILVRRAVVEQVGGIDERYFLYWEETEWCLRAARAGWRIVHVPKAKLWHKGVQRNYRPAPYVTYYSTRNRFLTLAKHGAPLRVWLGACLQVARTVVSWTVRPKWRSMRAHRHAMCRGCTDFLLRRWGGPVKL